MFFAVRNGKYGPAVYADWTDFQASVGNFPGAEYELFDTVHAATQWAAPRSDHLVSHDKEPTIDLTWSESESTLGEEEKPPAQPTKPPVKLSQEQENVFRLAMSGRNLFYTGSAGTGKSVVMREIISGLRERYGIEAVAVTASTGIAAVNIGGSTLHSFSGVGLGKEPAEQLLQKVRKNRITLQCWKHTKVLIIDEISMIDGLFFDKLEYIATNIRGEPNFGKLQLIVSGDFFQLPPVPEIVDRRKQPVTFCFDAKSWNRCVPLMLTLTQVFRQNDQEFVDILNLMRLGELGRPAIEKIRSLSRNVKYDDGFEPTELFPVREEAERANRARLGQLTTEEHVFAAMDWPGYDVRGHPIRQEDLPKLLERVMAPPVLTLRVGAQVMLVKNLPNGSSLVNGSLGKVIDFRAVSGSPPPYGEDDVPEETPKDVLWPVVQFVDGATMTLPPMQFSVENHLGRVEASRDQVPLILAWALSIHKSQGQTLSRVKINLGRVFEKGQSYVALSRATSMETLQVLNFQPAGVQAHPRVIAWSKTLTAYKDTVASGPQACDDPPDEFDEFDAEMDDLEAIQHYMETEGW